MLRKKFDQSRGGRKPLIKLYPSDLVLGNRKEEVALVAEIYGMTLEQAREQRKLRGMGKLYVTHHAKESCEYHVVVNYGRDVPQQGEFGANVVQIGVKRMDNKTDPVPWSDLQEIKRALLGENVEAIEIFPAHERRLRTEDKWRYLWAFPDGERIPVGWELEELKRKNRKDHFDPKQSGDECDEERDTPSDGNL